MEENKLPDSEGTNSLVDTQLQNVVDMTIKETDPQKVQDLTNLFAANMNKKNMVRIMKFNDLLDKVGDQAIKRFETRPDNFSNKEVLDYLNVVSTINDKNMAQLKSMNEAPIQLNQQHNEVNINIGEKNINNLNRESRERILNYINNILKSSEEDLIIDNDIVNNEEDSNEQ